MGQECKVLLDSVTLVWEPFFEPFYKTNRQATCTTTKKHFDSIGRRLELVQKQSFATLSAGWVLVHRESLIFIRVVTIATDGNIKFVILRVECNATIRDVIKQPPALRLLRIVANLPPNIMQT